jgi:hypothetical protein
MTSTAASVMASSAAAAVGPESSPIQPT